MSLSDFYHTKAWETFRKIVIDQRSKSDGFVYCDYCGQPIVKPYDLIVHHDLQLTETNYQDATIALNPNNIQLVHHACHNKIHSKCGFKTRKAYIVYGAPFSGKSTFVNQVKNDGDLIVDLDNIWECVSGCARYTKPPRLKAVVFDIRDELLNAVKYRRGNWNCAYIIGGYPLGTERDRLAGDIGAETILIDTPKSECLNRLYAADDGRGEEWLTYIAEWFELNAPPSSHPPDA